MFCPKCGNKEVVDVFCANCLKEEKPLLKGVKDISIEVCSVSGRVKHRNNWVETDDIQATIANAIKEYVVPAPDAEIKDIEVSEIPIDMKPGVKIQEVVLLSIIGRISKKAKFYREEYDVPVTINVTISPPYSKMGTSYFEATLQVRNETPESIKLMQEFLGNHRASVAKEVKEKNGTDYYITSKSATERAAYALQEAFGGLVKVNARLFSRNKQTSKDIYRITAFIELPPYKPGDVLEGEKGPMVVKQMGKKIRFLDLVRGKNTHLEYKDAMFPKMVVHETQVSENRPELLVLHPETFSAQRVENPAPVKDRVKVVIYGKKLYLVSDA